MSEGEADFFQVLVGQIAENAGINVIFGKTLRVLPEAKCVEPVRNMLHRGHRLPRCGLSYRNYYITSFVDDTSATDRPRPRWPGNVRSWCHSACNIDPRIASGRNVTRGEGLRTPQTGLEAAASSVEGLWAGRSDHYTQRRPQPRAVFPPAAWIR